MKSYKTLILISLLSILIQAQNPDLVIIMARHGARAVLSSQYNNDWSLNEFGDLTPTGMRQHYLLGSALSQQYSSLFPPPYFDVNTEILADNSPRTIQSALSQFYGIYLGIGPGFPPDFPAEIAVPPYNSPFINETLSKMNNSYALPFNHYPMITPIIDTSNFLVFHSMDACKKSGIWAAENEYDPETLKAWITFHSLIQNINKYATVATPADLVAFADAVICDYFANMTLPGNMPYDADLFANLTFASSWFITHIYGYQEVQQETAAWGYVCALVNYTSAYVAGQINSNYILLSGHDSNLLGLLMPMGVFNETCIMENFEAYWTNGSTPYPNCNYPDFAATMTVELYNASEPYVKIYYEGVLLNVCNGESTCSVSDFISYLQGLAGNMNYEQYVNVCGGINPESFDLNTDYMAVSKAKSNPIEPEYIIMGVLVLLGMILFAKLWKDSAKHKQELSTLQSNKKKLLT